MPMIPAVHDMCREKPPFAQFGLVIPTDKDVYAPGIPECTRQLGHAGAHHVDLWPAKFGMIGRFTWFDAFPDEQSPVGEDGKSRL